VNGIPPRVFLMLLDTNRDGSTHFGMF